MHHTNPTETLPAYAIHGTELGLLVACEIPRDTGLWLPPAAQAQLPQWRAEWRNNVEERSTVPAMGYARSPVTFDRFFGPEDAARLAREEMEAMERMRSLFFGAFGGNMADARLHILSPLEGDDDTPGSLGSGWASTLDDIDSLPSTE